MKKTTQILRSVILLMFTAAMFSSCVKKKYDDLETANVDPALTVTNTIKDLQTMAGPIVQNPVPILITTDIIIAGVVAGDDLSGNIYKKLILQQDSSGVAVQLDVTNFNTEYPTGRRVFVKCKGLYLENNGGNYELGIAPASPGLARIPAGLVTKYLVKGMWGQYITPKIYKFKNSKIPTNTLVRFDNVQFDVGFTGVAYAATSPANLDMIDCDSVRLILYSSTYSTFALAKTPYGKGSIVGVYTVFRGPGELQIRDTNDVNMTGLRCDNTTGIPDLMDINSIRLLDTLLKLPSNKKIIGVVTSNYSTGMLTSKNIYIQDNTAGIEVRFSVAHTFAIGTLLEVNISGLELSTFSGVLQISNKTPPGVPIINATVDGTGTITPRIVTIADINANYSSWEGQVVKINNVTISGSGMYSGSNTLIDATGNISLFTSSTATFASSTYPTGTVSVTGILTEFNGTKEILVRDTTDVH